MATTHSQCRHAGGGGGAVGVGRSPGGGVAACLVIALLGGGPALVCVGASVRGRSLTGHSTATAPDGGQRDEISRASGRPPISPPLARLRHHNEFSRCDSAAGPGKVVSGVMDGSGHPQRTNGNAGTEEHR